MQVIVVGAGVIGITTAYMLARQGHTVSVIEHREEAALGTSFANGGQLSYNHAEPWPSPMLAKQWMQWVFRKDSPLRYHYRFRDKETHAWAKAFLQACKDNKSQAHSLELLQLALVSKEELAAITRDTGIEYGHRECGTLHLFRDAKTLDAARRQSEFQASECTRRGAHASGMTEHCLFEMVSPDRLAEMEPALKGQEKKFVGGIYYPEDESGDAHAFTQALADYCKTHLHVRFYYHTEVRQIEAARGAAQSVRTREGRYNADIIVVAAGVNSKKLLQPLGIDLPIHPVAGYSVTVDAKDESQLPRHAVTDVQMRMVYSRLGNSLRGAGLADLGTTTLDYQKQRQQQARAHTSSLFPKAGNYAQAKLWTGYRPATPDGMPIVGRMGFDNLFVNAGHGTLGWTLAAGSARMVADMVGGHVAALEADNTNLPADAEVEAA